MVFNETPLAGAYVIEPTPHRDERGLFARTYCEREFSDRSLHTQWVQCNTSFNTTKFTLRGMHYQRAPHEEPKLVRVISGAIHDVIVDLRVDSPTYLQHFAVELSAENRYALYIPAGFAHGFLTLAPSSEVAYQMGAFYAPEAAAGLRYDDPALAITWPNTPAAISPRDAEYPHIDKDTFRP